MITAMKISLKSAVASFAAAGALMTVSPALASADPIDDALNALPSGQITCEQAEQYWTSESEYNSIRNQAKAVALFDPRGAEINAALDRVDEAANRCGLKGGGTPSGNNSAPAPNNSAPSNSAPSDSANNNSAGNNPAPSNPAPAPTGANVIEIPTPAGTPTVDVPVADVATIRIPDFLAIVRNYLASLNLPFDLPALPQGSSL